MSIMNFVQAGLVIGVVIVIQVIKSLIDNKRIENGKFKLKSDFWVLIVLLCGVPMAIIVNCLDGVDLNFFQVIKDSFIYAAAASFTYKTYSVTKKRNYKR